MTKEGFLRALHDRLNDFPQEDVDVEEHLNFYREMIEDRMEEGLSEEAAVAAVGTADEIAAQIAADIPPGSTVKVGTRQRRRLKGWETALLILGSPLWLSMLIALFAVALSLLAALWAVIVSLWAVFAAIGACAVCCEVAGILYLLRGDPPVGAALLGAGLVCAGLAILLFFVCRAASKGALRLTGKTFTVTRRSKP